MSARRTSRRGGQYAGVRPLSVSAVLNLTHVTTFLAVVDRGGFREAARHLRTSQPTVTQHIKKLESALGTRLIHRHRPAGTPTPAGQRFLPHARRLIEAADRAHDAIARRRMDIGASSNIGTYLLQPRLKAFLEGYSARIELQLCLGSNPQIAERLTRGEVDIGLMEWWDQRPGFRAVVWRQEPMVVIVPPPHPWAKRRSVSRQLLCSTPLIGGEPGSGTATLLARTFGTAAAELRISMSLGSTEAVKQAVIAGLGVSIVLASTVHDQVRAGLLHALPISGARVVKDLFVLIPDDLPPTSAAHAFAEHLSQRASQAGGRR